MWNWLSNLAPPFALAGAAQEMTHVVIIFVTSILIHLLTGIDAVPRNSHSPWPGPGVRVLDRVLVIHRPGVYAGKALGQTEGRGVGCLKDVGIRPEISGLDDQGIRLP